MKIFVTVTSKKWLNMSVRIDQDQITVGVVVEIQTLTRLQTAVETPLFDPKAHQDAIDFKLFQEYTNSNN